MKLFKEVIRNNLRMIVFYVLIGILMTFLNLYCIHYFQEVMDAFQFGTLSIRMLMFYGVILILSTIIGYVNNYPQEKIKNGLYLDFKLQSLKKMKSIDYLEYQKLGTGKLTQRVEDGSAAAREVVYQFWLRLIRELLPTALFGLLFMYFIQKELIIFVLLGYVVVIVVSNIVLKKLYKLKEEILVNQELLNKHLVRGFMELVVFRTNKKYDVEIEASKTGIKTIVDSKTKIKLVHELFFTIFGLIVNVLQVSVLVYAMFYSDFTVGAVVTVVALLGKVYEPIAIFNVEYIDYKLNKLTLKRYLDFLDTKDDETLFVGKKLKQIDGKITIKNVSFAYSNKTVISDLSLEISKNKSIALVGESGSGKSTIIKLLIGLIKPNEGEIYVDGNKLSDLNLNAYYDYLSYVSQDAPIFDGTLRENLVFDKKIPDEELLKVLKVVCLDKFYENLEFGLDSELGEKGIKMSGGERQRVALARLFFDNSKIVILDEATSAMDNITEKIVMQNIVESLKDKTIVVIAHRLETIKDVDQIYVLLDGKIVEKGKYSNLLKKRGYFTRLYSYNKK